MPSPRAVGQADLFMASLMTSAATEEASCYAFVETFEYLRVVRELACPAMRRISSKVRPLDAS